MQLNNVQEASLRRLQRYRTHPPTLSERIRLSAMFALGLLVPVVIAGFVLIQLDVPGALFLLAGLYVGAVAREIGQHRLFVLWWPMNRHITDWDKVDDLLTSPNSLPDVEPSAPPRKLKLIPLVGLGVGLFAVIFVAAIFIERALAFAHDPTRGNPPDNVIVLTTSWCGYCRTLRQHLAERNIPYTDLDVEQTTEGRYAYHSVRGSGVPITIVGSQVIRGVGRPDVRWRSIDGALSAAGYDMPSASQAGGQRDGDWIDSAIVR